jgi:hypothetical protein
MNPVTELTDEQFMTARGNTIKVVMPDGYTNDWGREGLCVPTS